MDFRAMLMRRKKPAKKVVVVSKNYSRKNNRSHSYKTYIQSNFSVDFKSEFYIQVFLYKKLWEEKNESYDEMDLEEARNKYLHMPGIVLFFNHVKWFYTQQKIRLNTFHNRYRWSSIPSGTEHLLNEHFYENYWKKCFKGFNFWNSQKSADRL